MSISIGQGIISCLKPRRLRKHVHLTVVISAAAYTHHSKTLSHQRMIAPHDLVQFSLEKNGKKDYS